MGDENQLPDPNSTSETTTETPSIAASVQAHAEAVNADVSDEADGADEGGDEGTEESSSGAELAADGTAVAGAPGEGGKKRKRRRRKKKTGAPGEELAAGANAAGANATGEGGEAKSGEPRKKSPPKKDPGQIPFGRYFDGGHARRHAFAVGEVVAGRVAKLLEGAFLVDLFGKATAVVDENEPREVPLPAPEPTLVVAAEVSTEVAAAAEGATAETASAAGDAAVEITASAESTGAAPSDSTQTEVAHADEAAHVEAAHVDDHDHGHDHAVEDEHADDDGDASSAGNELAAPLEPEAAAPVPAPAVGTIFRGRVGAVAESGHIAIINRIVDVKVARTYLEKAREDKKRVRGVVYGFNRGGFDVLVEGIRVFCPASGMALSHIENPEEYVGQKLEFSVPPQKPGFHGTVVSRRSILEREGRKAARERLKTMKVGETVKGRVSQVRDFGFFIDIGGGLEGMVHVSEMSWDRMARPSDVAKVGDELEARVIKIPDNKKERHERIGLSLKVLQADPWDVHGELLAEGRSFKGKVARVAEFGAFIEIAPGVEGLLHVSELGRDLAHAKDAVKVGDELDLIIERTDKKQHRVSLSKLSAADVASLAEGGSLAARPPKLNSLTKVKVDRVEPHGVFVQVVGVVGKRGRGYIPNSEMGTERGTDHRRLFPQGRELDVKVIGTDRDGSLKFSRKAFTNDEEKRAVQDYRREAAKQGFGTFGDLLRQKLEKGTS
ncbi:MAG: S1 RNA-binding domain-containing protein [Sandaracinaceae bacterium]|nr:S1 RNA-binding domain-containing protein [Sandaracinaceae bacterium]